MTTALEDAWGDVITNITGPASIPALVNVLDKYQQLDHIKERVLAEAADELRADHERQPDTYGTAARWLRDQLANGERRSRELAFAAARDGIGWRTIERVKRRAGVSAARHDRASWWSLVTPTPPTPPNRIQPPVTV